MPKTNTSVIKLAHIEPAPSLLTSSTLELVNWSSLSSDKVLALQTSRIAPPPSPQTHTVLNKALKSNLSTYGGFNLGLHVGDNSKTVISHRKELCQFIHHQLSNVSTESPSTTVESVKIQWLEQVHGNKVVEINVVSNNAVTADASITRQKNIALAIMTADCLPILLTNKKGSEIAAIHGGWRPLAANIIERTLNKMHSESSDIIAWLGPCIGKHAFEVGPEVKENFIEQDTMFDQAFLEQRNGKYLADLHKIAQLQLLSLGVTAIASLDDCTYERTDKYYSYRKEQVTGRMASVICRR